MDLLELELVASVPLDLRDLDIPTDPHDLELVADLIVPKDPRNPELELVVGDPAAPIQQGAKQGGSRGTTLL
jgi:hypothetical protein